MNRIGFLLALISFTLLILPGCDEETTAVVKTGMELRCSGCLPFGVYVLVDGEPVGEFSSEEPHFFELPGGNYELYAYSNAKNSSTNLYYCWHRTIAVSEGNVTSVVLLCSDDSLCE